jgi:hypothetical protein
MLQRPILLLFWPCYLLLIQLTIMQKGSRNSKIKLRSHFTFITKCYFVSFHPPHPRFSREQRTTMVIVTLFNHHLSIDSISIYSKFMFTSSIYILLINLMTFIVEDSINTLINHRSYVYRGTYQSIHSIYYLRSFLHC